MFLLKGIQAGWRNTAVISLLLHQLHPEQRESVSIEQTVPGSDRYKPSSRALTITETHLPAPASLQKTQLDLGIIEWMSLPNLISACILSKSAQGLSLQLHHLDANGATTIWSTAEGRLEQSENAITPKLGTDLYQFLPHQIRESSASRLCKVISSA